MQKALHRFVFLILMVSSFSVNASISASACDTPPAFAVGDVVQVNPGQAQNVRAKPTTSADVLVSVPAGENLTIWDGPTCADGYTWWKVNYGQQVGWTAEAPIGSTEWLSKIETQTFARGGVHFQYDPLLLSGAAIKDWDWTYQEGGIEIPPHRSFLIQGYPVTRDEPYDPELNIYPRNADADDALSITSLTMDTFTSSITADLMTFYTLPESHAPTTIAYFNFKSGVGDRGVNYPIPQPPPGEYRPVEPIFGYHFYGLTDDGAYYIDGYFPLDVNVTMPDFPVIPTLAGTVPEAGTQYDTVKGNPLYRDYLTEIFTRVAAVTPDGYTPRLALLDAMMRSIEITGTIELKP